MSDSITVFLKDGSVYKLEHDRPADLAPALPGNALQITFHTVDKGDVAFAWADVERIDANDGNLLTGLPAERVVILG